MLFMGSQNAPYLEKYRDPETPDNYTTNSLQRKNLRNISLALTGFYILVSLVVVVFYLPYSFSSLLFPTITLLLTFCACKMKNKESFWPCILMASLGLLLKLIACIVYISIFGFTGEQVVTKPTLYKSRKPATMATDMKAAFFGILTAVELFFLILTCCVQWHLIAFKKCMET